MKIKVHVKPNSKKEIVEIMEDGSYLVKVNVPPREGLANQRVVELLAKKLNKPKSALSLISGNRGKKKIFEIL